MDNERLKLLTKLTKYPTYKIVDEIKKLESTAWVDLLVSQDILSYNSRFWDEVKNKNAAYSAFWVFVVVFRRQLRNNPYLGSAIDNLLNIEINNMSSDLILKRTQDICNYIIDNNDLNVISNYMMFLKKLYIFSRAEYLKHLYYFTLYYNNQPDASITAKPVFEMLIDLIIQFPDVNYSGVVSHIFYSKLYLFANIKTINNLISIMDNAFIYSGYSTWLSKNKIIHETKITFDTNKVIIFNNANGNIQELDMLELNPDSDGIDSILAEGLSHYIKMNGYNEVSKTDILMSIRNIKYYGFFDRAFKFSFHEGKMEFYQTIGCLLNFIMTNKNLEFDSIDLKVLINSQFKFLQAYGLYLTYLSNNESFFNQFVDNTSVLTELFKNEHLEFYVTSIINNLYSKLSIQRKNILDAALEGLREHKQINRILNINHQLFDFEFDRNDNVKVRTEGSFSFGTITDVPVIELDNLYSLSDDDFIVLINDIDINEEKYKDKDFVDYKVKNAKGTFENLTEHLEKRLNILDSSKTFTPQVLYYNFDSLKRLYNIDRIYKYCFSSMSIYYVSNELLSKMAWNIHENINYFKDDLIVSSDLLNLYSQFFSENSIVFDTLEINPSKTKYKTWSSGKEYVDIESSYINSNVHSVFDPIYKLTEICKSDFTILKNLLSKLYASKNHYWSYIASKYFELFEFYDDVIKRETLDAVTEEMLVFGVLSSEHYSIEYFNVVQDFIKNKKDSDLISKDEESFNRGYAIYAVYGYISNWDKALFRQYLFKCFYKKANFQNLIDISFRLHNFGNSFLLRESIDCIYDRIKNDNADVKQLTSDFAHEIIPLLRSISKFDSEVKSLVDNMINLINKSEAYKRLDLVLNISFGLDEYNRSVDEKIVIKEIIKKLSVDDFDGFEKQLLDETLKKL